MALQTQEFKLRRRTPMSGRALVSPVPDGIKARIETAESHLADAFKGVTTDGSVRPGLYTIQNTGSSTSDIKTAADSFLDSLDPALKADATFEVDSEEWRRWCNIHPYLMRHGAFLDAASSSQRDLAMGLLRESLSPAGFETARNTMKLNEAIREITGSNEEYGEWLYWLSIMGTPSDYQPWGWQIDGHHLIINFFVLGDQVVMTPAFMGSEPVAVDVGKYAGTRVFEAEEQAGLALAQSLSVEQKRQMVISEDMPSEVFTTAFRDNFEMKHEGLKYDDLSSNQQSLVMSLIGAYVNRMRSGHAQIKMDEVKSHLSETYIAWMGSVDEDSVFYYRIHSPVILIEFDHQSGIALDSDVPMRQHIHTVVRTPNGNDYGKDLLRQHREQADHSHD